MKKAGWFEIALFTAIVSVMGFLTIPAAIQQRSEVVGTSSVLPQIIQEVRSSVVHITNNTCGWQGSGVVITKDIIVTARHVVKDGIDFTVTLENGNYYKATKAISHKEYDIGFLKLESAVLRPAKFGSVNDCVLGQPLFAIGSMAGKINFNSVSLGIVSGLNRGGDWKDRTGKDYGWSILFQTDAEGMGGNSGCPVFTMDGIVRGVWVGSMPPAVHYCIPVDVFLADIGMIQLIFGTDNYKFEKVQPFNDGTEWQCQP